MFSNRKALNYLMTKSSH